MNYHALVPAAGSGSRMGSPSGSTLPKQYLPLAGRPMIWHALATLCATPAIASVVVVLSPDDRDWPDGMAEELGAKLHVLRCGGATRAQSVANGLRGMADTLGRVGDDWVLVHDAARCLIQAEQIEALLAACQDDEVGGLLAVPLADTMKSAAGDRVQETLDRTDKWLAQTPQMFRVGKLIAALELAGDRATDEASAIELLGLRPKLVMGDALNLKVTYAQDFVLAELVLRQRQRLKQNTQ